MSDPELTNKESLLAAGMRLTRSVGSSLKARWDILDVGDTLTESHAFWQSGFRGRTHGHFSDTMRVAAWIEQAAAEQDEIQSFVLAWIGFNGLYGWVSNVLAPHVSTDADKFEVTIDNLINEAEATQIARNYAAQLSSLESFGITSASGGRNFSQELRGERTKAAPNYVSILKLATRCIYGIRKEVFHEAPQPENVVHRANTARTVLVPIVQRCLKNSVVC